VRQRLAAGSQVVATRMGPVEYARVGQGPPVLVVHGYGGGYDQGLLAAQLAATYPLEIIAVSRFGYLRTPLPADPSPAAQAAALVALLDALQIPTVAILAISAGGPAVLEFALRYPDRCWALVTIAAVTGPLAVRTTARGRLIAALAGQDWGLWLLRGLTLRQQLVRNGLDPATVDRLPAAARERVRSLFYPLPISLRRAGCAADLRGFPHLPRYPVAQLALPTLVVHGTADTVVPLAHAEWLAATVPGARFLPIPGGGHACPLTHEAAVIPPVFAFLRAHVPPAILGWGF
ncbi:MAG TPA: alpha/beta hydrolase, partial [Chloroflexia bacterium]|nr:alpha/beta hydrolase [Chloroflexia bacterium]